VKILIERPPMWDRIVARFPEAKRPGVIFTWGQTIYNPGKGQVTRELMKHEEVHAERQGPSEEAITAWWERYLIDPNFRFEEELPAHRAEYRAYCKRHSQGQARYLRMVAQRLCGPLYGRVIDYKTAINRILLP